jgi:hypothetical protein
MGEDTVLLPPSVALIRRKKVDAAGLRNFIPCFVLHAITAHCAVKCETMVDKLTWHSLQNRELSEGMTTNKHTISIVRYNG